MYERILVYRTTREYQRLVASFPNLLDAFAFVAEQPDTETFVLRDIENPDEGDMTQYARRLATQAADHQRRVALAIERSAS